MRSRALISALVVALLSPGYRASAQVAQQGKTSAVKRAIDDLWARVIAADKKGDAAAVAAIYAEDATVIDPGSPTVSGKANIEKFYRDGFASTKILDITRTPTSLEVSGNLAVETGTYTQRVQEAGKGPTEVQARYTVVFKNVSGHWRVLRDVATPMPGQTAK